MIVCTRGGDKWFMKYRDRDAISNSKISHILDEIKINMLDIYGPWLKKIIFYLAPLQGEKSRPGPILIFWFF